MNADVITRSIFRWLGQTNNQKNTHTANAHTHVVVVDVVVVVVADVVVVVVVDVDAETNRRVSCNKAMEATKEHCVWFGMEQEYCLLAIDGYPYRWPKSGFPRPQGEPNDQPTSQVHVSYTVH